MLRISAEQMRKLDEMASANFETKLAEFLRSELPDQVSHVDEVQMAAICTHVVRAAAQFGIVEPVPIAQLACLAVATNGKLLVQPEIVEYLSDQGLPATQRVQLLVDELSAME